MTDSSDADQSQRRELRRQQKASRDRIEMLIRLFELVGVRITVEKAYEANEIDVESALAFQTKVYGGGPTTMYIALVRALGQCDELREYVPMKDGRLMYFRPIALHWPGSELRCVPSIEQEYKLSRIEELNK